MTTLRSYETIHCAKEADLSVSELRDKLANAIKAELNPGQDVASDGAIVSPSIYAYVEEVYPSSQKFVYRVKGQTFIRSYSLKNGVVKLGGDTKQARQRWMEVSRKDGRTSLYGYGTSEGASKGWDKRGRGHNYSDSDVESIIEELDHKQSYHKDLESDHRDTSGNRKMRAMTRDHLNKAFRHLSLADKFLEKGDANKAVHHVAMADRHHEKIEDLLQRREDARLNKELK